MRFDRDARHRWTRAHAAGNRVVTGNALKVSDRWSSIVGSDPYASEKKEDGDVMEKLWGTSVCTEQTQNWHRRARHSDI